MVQRSVDLEDNLEALRDEVNLLKVEIKQTLVDLRELVMKDRTIMSQPWQGQVARSSPSKPETGQQDQARGAVGHTVDAPAVSNPRAQPLDAATIGNIIWWLGTVKRRGLSLPQLTPLLEAYELSGYLMPTMARYILRSMADLDDLEPSPVSTPFSSQDYAECLRQLHDIVCTPGFVVGQAPSQSNTEGRV